ncbi:MAG: helix-turn-helix transcriptional regulator [Bacteroidota bacterium]
MAKNTKPRYADPKVVLKKVGERVRELRLAKGESNAERFALENEMNRVQYNRYENGEDMRLSSLLKVLNALDITLDEFFDERFKG